MGKHYFVLHKNNAGKCMIEIQEESKLIGGLPMTIGKSRVFDGGRERTRQNLSRFSDRVSSEGNNLTSTIKETTPCSTKHHSQRFIIIATAICSAAKFGYANGSSE